jgi:hypothetical protein
MSPEGKNARVWKRLGCGFRVLRQTFLDAGDAEGGVKLLRERLNRTMWVWEDCAKLRGQQQLQEGSSSRSRGQPVIMLVLVALGVMVS